MLLVGRGGVMGTKIVNKIFVNKLAFSYIESRSGRDIPGVL